MKGQRGSPVGITEFSLSGEEEGSCLSASRSSAGGLSLVHFPMFPRKAD